MNIIYIVLLICLASYLLMFFYFKRYIKKRASSGLLPEEKKEVSRLIVDLNAVTDRNLLLIEDKIKQLKEILDDTDKRISVYVKELEKSRTGEMLYTSLGRGIKSALKTSDDYARDAAKGAQQSALYTDLSHSNLMMERTVKPQIQNASAVQLELEQDKTKPPSKKQIRTSIDLLANEGLPPEEIASRLDISIAEVDFAMNLRRKKN